MRPFLFLLLFVTVVAQDWPHLSFDSENFLCDKWDTFCEQILDEIGCGHHDHTDRIIEGCSPGNNLGTDYVGKCSCLSPIYFDQAGKRVAQQLMSNRIAADVSWMIEPWNKGPPYDLPRTFTGICDTLLDRLGCRSQYRIINATNYAIVDGQMQTNMICTCGNLTDSSLHVNRLIMDKFNDYNNRATPVFEDPIYLSVPLSICMILICGKLGGILAVYLKLPPIIGFLMAGLGIQNILNPMFLKGPGFPFPSPASEIKKIALILVLMRAGLAIKFEEIYSTSLPTALLCSLPYLAEFFIWMYAGQTVFDWKTIDMGLWASIMAPLGPSVVISGLLLLIGNQKKDYGYPVKQILISSPIEAVLAIVFFGIFQNLAQTERSTLYPWVDPLPLWLNALLVPVNILFSIVLGVICGYFASKYIDWRSKIKNDFIWVRVHKNPQMGSSTADLVFVLVVLCYTMFSLCVQQYIQQCSGVLVVFAMCITVSILADSKITVDIAQGLKGIWLFAEVFLFTLTGTSLSFDSTNGPLYGQRGLSPENIRKVIGMMFVGVSARLGALIIIGIILYQFMPPHRRTLAWMGRFCIVCWIFQLPKATVQATLGSVAYYQNVLPGEDGLKEGLFIAQSTAFTVLIFAPLGALLTNYLGAPISEHLTKLDVDAGWKHNEFRYSPDSPFYTPVFGEDEKPRDHSIDSLEEKKISGGSNSEEELGMHEQETIEDTARAVVTSLFGHRESEHHSTQESRVRGNTFDAFHILGSVDHSEARRNTISGSPRSRTHSHGNQDGEGFFHRLRSHTLDALRGGTALEDGPKVEIPTIINYTPVPIEEESFHVPSKEFDATAESYNENDNNEISISDLDTKTNSN